MSRFTLIKTPDDFDLALAERQAQADTIDPTTALIEARIQVVEFRQSYPQAA